MPVYDLSEKPREALVSAEKKPKGKYYWQSVGIQADCGLKVGSKVSGTFTGEVTEVSMREDADRKGKRESTHITLHTVEIGGKGSESKARAAVRSKMRGMAEED